MTLTAQVAAAVQLSLPGDADLGFKGFNLLKFGDTEFLDGISNGQADLAFVDKRTIAGSGTDSLDLAGGSLTDPNGNALTFAKVKVLLIRADKGNAGDVRVGGNANAFVGPFVAGTHEFDVEAGGTALHVAPNTGWTVVATTGDILDIENLAVTQAIYDIVILGTSA